VLVTKHLTKRYESRVPLTILEDVSLEVRAGESLAIMGPSGSGKSTLLHVLGALDPPTSGSVEFDGVDPYALGEREQAAFRGKQIGFVFQDHLLLPQLTALANVLVPTLTATRDGSASARDAHARELLAAVGLGDRMAHRPAELSGGERQRVAIARALVRQPALLLCDEPTGNLDRASAEAVADLLVSLHVQRGMMLVAVTHSTAFADRFARRCELRDRRVIEVGRGPAESGGLKPAGYN
jgi:lipoprotein-releasing system ATP-binding protein